MQGANNAEHLSMFMDRKCGISAFTRSCLKGTYRDKRQVRDAQVVEKFRHLHTRAVHHRHHVVRPGATIESGTDHIPTQNAQTLIT